MCDECEEYFAETYPVHSSGGEVIYVCAGCRDRYYAYCEECHEYHPKDEVITVEGGRRVCSGCLDRRYKLCDDCGNYFRSEELRDGLCSICRTHAGGEKELVA